MVGIPPEQYYEMTLRELGAVARGYRNQEQAAISRIRLAVWGDQQTIRRVLGAKRQDMTPQEFAALRREIEGEQIEA